MGKFVKIALVFMGGMTAGGYCVVNAALKSETFTTALKDAVAKKVTEAICDSVYDRRKRARQDVTYKSFYDTRYKARRLDCCLENCDDLVFETRKDAEDTLAAMLEIVEKYGCVSLADVYEIAKITSIPYAANKYGWTSLDCGEVIRCRDGYYIKLPRAIELK